MYSYVRTNIAFKLPKLIEESIKSLGISIDEHSINTIMNQIMYYTTNYCHAFNVPRDGILVEINPIDNTAREKYGYKLVEEYTLHIKLHSRNTTKKYTMRELIFLLNTGKLLAIYHYRYKPVVKNGSMWHKIYTVPTGIIENIKEHSDK